jgi:hypothetical protein
MSVHSPDVSLGAVAGSPANTFTPQTAAVTVPLPAVPALPLPPALFMVPRLAPPDATEPPFVAPALAPPLATLPPLVVLLPPLALPPVELASSAGEAVPGSEPSPQPKVTLEKARSRQART